MDNKSNVTLKTLNVMKAFIDKQMIWGVNELARYLESPPSSIHRILKTLKEEHILQVIPDSNKYTIGNEWMRLSSFISANFGLKSIAEPYIRELAKQVNHSVYLALYQQQHRKLSFVAGVHSANALQYRLDLGVLHPIHIGASGKAILSYLSEDEITLILKEEHVSSQESRQIWMDIQEIREQGYSYTLSERKSESIGIGAPIFDANSKVIGSIICAIPSNLYKEDEKGFTVDHILSTAKEISYNLGYLENR